MLPAGPSTRPGFQTVRYHILPYVTNDAIDGCQEIEVSNEDVLASLWLLRPRTILRIEASTSAKDLPICR